MEKPEEVGATLDGFSPISSTRVFWRSRRRSASMHLDKVTGDTIVKTPEEQKESPMEENQQDQTPAAVLSERRKALFEPLEPIKNIMGQQVSAKNLLPPPDFDYTSYPRGWLIGKKRKLVNVDVVESMRRIAVQEMNRKDKQIDGLNEQLDEDARCLEHLQLQLLEERSKRANVERENTMLKQQITMLEDLLQESETIGEEDPEEQ